MASDSRAAVRAAAVAASPLHTRPRSVTAPVAGLAVWLATAMAAPGQSSPAAAHQAEDGRIVVPGGSVEELRCTALTVLALLADGSTVRAGPDRVVLRRSVKWLRASIDVHGRVGYDAHPGWLLDHMLAATAITEALRLSEYRFFQHDVVAVVDAAARGLAQPGLVDVETLWWAAWLADAAQHFDAEMAPWFEDASPGQQPPCRWLPGAIRWELLDLGVRCAVSRMPPAGVGPDALRLRHLRAMPLDRLGSPRELAPAERFVTACLAFAPDSLVADEFTRRISADPVFGSGIADQGDADWTTDRAYDRLTMTLYYRCCCFDSIAGRAVDPMRAWQRSTDAESGEPRSDETASRTRGGRR